MSTRRTAKVAQAIRQVVSTTILFGLRDPRVKNVTVLHVEVPSDLRTAKVYVSLMGDAATQNLSYQGLNAAKGYLQSKIADELQLRYTPVLTFVVDEGIKKSIEASRILRELELEPAAGDADPNEKDRIDERRDDGDDAAGIDDDGDAEPGGDAEHDEDDDVRDDAEPDDAAPA